MGDSGEKSEQALLLSSSSSSSAGSCCNCASSAGCGCNCASSAGCCCNCLHAPVDPHSVLVQAERRFSVCADAVCKLEVMNCSSGGGDEQCTHVGQETHSSSGGGGDSVLFAVSPAGRPMRCVTCTYRRALHATEAPSNNGVRYVGVCSQQCANDVMNCWDSVSKMCDQQQQQPQPVGNEHTAKQPTPPHYSYSLAMIVSRLFIMYQTAQCKAAAAAAASDSAAARDAQLDAYGSELYRELRAGADAVGVSSDALRDFLVMANSAVGSAGALVTPKLDNGRTPLLCKGEHSSIELAAQLLGMLQRFVFLRSRNFVPNVRLFAFRQNFIYITARLALALDSLSAACGVLEKYVFTVRYHDAYVSTAPPPPASDESTSAATVNPTESTADATTTTSTTTTEPIGLSLPGRALLDRTKNAAASLSDGYSTKVIEDELVLFYQSVECRAHGSADERQVAFQQESQTFFDQVAAQLRNSAAASTRPSDFAALIEQLRQATGGGGAAAMIPPRPVDAARCQRTRNGDALRIANELAGLFRFVVQRSEAIKDTSSATAVEQRKRERLAKARQDWARMVARLASRVRLSAPTSSSSKKDSAAAYEAVARWLVARMLTIVLETMQALVPRASSVPQVDLSDARDEDVARLQRFASAAAPPPPPLRSVEAALVASASSTGALTPAVITLVPIEQQPQPERVITLVPVDHDVQAHAAQNNNVVYLVPLQHQKVVGSGALVATNQVAEYQRTEALYELPIDVGTQSALPLNIGASAFRAASDHAQTKAGVRRMRRDRALHVAKLLESLSGGDANAVDVVTSLRRRTDIDQRQYREITAAVAGALERDYGEAAAAAQGSVVDLTHVRGNQLRAALYVLYERYTSWSHKENMVLGRRAVIADFMDTLKHVVAPMPEAQRNAALARLRAVMRM